MTGVTLMEKMSEIEMAKRLEEIEAREQELEKREKVAAAKGLRQNLYDRITCTLGTVDAIIMVCAALIIALTVIGTVYGGKF